MLEQAIVDAAEWTRDLSDEVQGSAARLAHLLRTARADRSVNDTAGRAVRDHLVEVVGLAPEFQALIDMLHGVGGR
ncbi:MAG: hypothetical protein JST00_30205 [Deltaproteobacteria bacterium]|nr:hypothetical protein [Deltaproteobacteria bacterium]